MRRTLLCLILLGAACAHTPSRETNPMIEKVATGEFWYRLEDEDGKPQGYARLVLTTPEAGGLSSRELLEFMRVIFARLPVRALDIVEVSPPLDCNDITSTAAVKVIYEVFGWVMGR